MAQQWNPRDRRPGAYKVYQDEYKIPRMPNLDPPVKCFEKGCIDMEKESVFTIARLGEHYRKMHPGKKVPEFEPHFCKEVGCPEQYVVLGLCTEGRHALLRHERASNHREISKRKRAENKRIEVERMKQSANKEPKMNKFARARREKREQRAKEKAQREEAMEKKKELELLQQYLTQKRLNDEWDRNRSLDSLVVNVPLEKPILKHYHI